jgi:Ca-activated chloride channel homolog
MPVSSSPRRITFAQSDWIFSFEEKKMPTKRSLAFLALMLVLVVSSACGTPAATPAPAEQYQAPTTHYKPAATSEPAQEYLAPAATEAPAAPAAPSTRQDANGAMNPKSPAQPPSSPSAPDMFFQNYGVNPMEDTEDDHLSTFALDVDTGAYTIMRRYINDGNLPPKDAVRVEEFVNYFDQGYRYPPEHQAFGISIDGASTPFGETERYQMLRVGIQGYAVPAEERKNVSLTFVIDVSGSMSQENRLELVKRSLELLVEQLRRSDQVSIVVYGTEAHVVLEPTSGDDTETILDAIHSLQPEGVTNAEAGLRLGYKMASRAFNPEGINRVILCSDGVANLGDTSADSIWDHVKRRAGEGITLTTVGFGMGNYNDVLMEQLADNGNGFYTYVDSLKEARRLFVENLTSTLQVIAMDAKVQVDFNPQVVARYRLVGFENRAVADQDFRNNAVDAGEIGAGHSVTALYEIKFQPEAVGRIATVSLRWKDPDTHDVTEKSQDFNTDQMAGSFDEANPHFQWAVVVAEYAEILRDSYWAQDSSLDKVLKEAYRISDQLPNDKDISEFVDLVRRASEMRGE